MVSARKASGDGRGKNNGKRKAKSTPSVHMDQVNPHAAGIDTGSEVHYVAVSPEVCDEPVRHFGCYTPDLQAMAHWLKECKVTTVAMESTAVYWVPVYQVLEAEGFDVSLVDARHVNNVPGRETDVDDAQWLRKLHSFGLLRGCFIPGSDIVRLRTYWRYRGDLCEQASRRILRMHKALEQMNLQSHKALSDASGVTGMSILRAIIAGERDTAVLAAMREPNVKKSEEEIRRALTGNWIEERLYLLDQAVQLYDVFHGKIAECDKKIEECMQRSESKADPSELPPPKHSHTRRKNEPHFDPRKHLFRLTGVDLTVIDGVEAMTIESVISEIGTDVSAFPTEKHFASWMGLCPHNTITGGKVKKRSTRKVQNRAANALRLAAQSLHHSKSALGAYFRRIQTKTGTAKTITATAHKLACLIYRMLKYGFDYVDKCQELYNKQYQGHVLKHLRKQAESLGHALTDLQTGGVP